jgi:hypothetical protein
MQNWIIITLMLAVAVACYIFGLARGVKETENSHKNDYDEGYLVGYKDAQQEYYTNERQKKLDALAEGLQEAFEGDEVLDCGTY